MYDVRTSTQLLNLWVSRSSCRETPRAKIMGGRGKRTRLEMNFLEKDME